MAENPQVSVVKLSPKDRREDQAKIDKAKAEFFAKGGVIQKVPGYEFDSGFYDIPENERERMKKRAEVNEERRRPTRN